MKLLKVSSCCCFDLRTGALIIGYIELVSNFLNVFTYPSVFSLALAGMFFKI